MERKVGESVCERECVFAGCTARDWGREIKGMVLLKLYVSRRTDKRAAVRSLMLLLDCRATNGPGLWEGERVEKEHWVNE